MKTKIVALEKPQRRMAITILVLEVVLFCLVKYYAH